jgi:hypothetical protein
MKIDILKRINRALSPNKVDFSAIDSEINALKKKLEETVNIQTVDDVKFQLAKFKKNIDLTPLREEIEKIGQIFTEKSKELQSQINEKSKELETAKKAIVENETGGSGKITLLTREIRTLRTDLNQLEVVHEADLTSLNQSIAEVREIEGRVNETINKLSEGLNIYTTKKETQAIVKEIQEKIDELRRDILKRVGNIGGSMNRQIFVGGNDPLTKYADINLKAGSNVTITYANNNTTKKAEITISSTGGSGTTRSINSIAVDTNAGDTAGTDYVYLVTGTTILTLPTAVGNENLYTVKNVGVGIVTIATTGGETIDNEANVVMPVRYTSVDLISDSLNWNVT